LILLVRFLTAPEGKKAAPGALKAESLTKAGLTWDECDLVTWDGCSRFCKMFLRSARASVNAQKKRTRHFAAPFAIDASGAHRYHF